MRQAPTPATSASLTKQALSTTFRVPNDAQPGETIHVILEATDDGTPPLTRYQRLIVRIQ